jgi:hypothetical protein
VDGDAHRERLGRLDGEVLAPQPRVAERHIALVRPSHDQALCRELADHDRALVGIGRLVFVPIGVLERAVVPTSNEDDPRA